MIYSRNPTLGLDTSAQVLLNPGANLHWTIRMAVNGGKSGSRAFAWPINDSLCNALQQMEDELRG